MELSIATLITTIAIAYMLGMITAFDSDECISTLQEVMRVLWSIWG